MSVLGIGGALAMVLGMGDRPRPSRRVFVPEEVVEVGCRLYRVVAVAADGEPTLERIDDPPPGWAIPPLARALSRPLDLDVMRGTRVDP